MPDRTDVATGLAGPEFWLGHLGIHGRDMGLEKRAAGRGILYGKGRGQG